MHRDWRSCSTAADSVSRTGRDGLGGGVGHGGRTDASALKYRGAERVGSTPVIVWSTVGGVVVESVVKRDTCRICGTVTDPEADCECDGCSNTYCPCHTTCPRHSYPDA